jgi:hypothetical protein
MFQTILVALFALLLGLGLTFAGYRFFRFLIPFWGFFVGLSIGAQTVQALFGTGFLSTVTGWVVGFIVGLALALLAYFFYSLAIILLGASTGYWLGAGLMTAIGFDPGLISTLVGIAFAVIFALMMMVLNMPKIYAVVLTSAGGASALLAGVLLLFGQIPLDALGQGALSAVLFYSTFWLLIWLAVMAFGIVVQLRSSVTYMLQAY